MVQNSLWQIRVQPNDTPPLVIFRILTRRLEITALFTLIALATPQGTTR